MTLTEAKTTLAELIEIGMESEEAKLTLSEMADGETDFEAGNYRIIGESSIDDIMKEELSSDLYCLGCCASWLISDNTPLSIKAVEALQDADQYEVLGELMMDNIEEITWDIVRHDGYGPHFAQYDGNHHEVADYHVFKIS